MSSAADQPSPSNMREQSRRDSDDGTSIAALHQSRRSSPAVSKSAATTFPDAAPSAAQAAVVAAAARSMPSRAAAGMPLTETSTSRPLPACMQAPQAATDVAAVGIIHDGDASAVGVLGLVTVAATVAGLSIASGAPPSHFAAAGARVGTKASPQRTVLRHGAELQPSVSAGTPADAATAAADGCGTQMPPDVSTDDCADQSQPRVVRRPSACASEPDITSVSRLAVRSALSALAHTQSGAP
jgi:hypothetical protein